MFALLAELPTTDVFMTEVGRYEPPTNKPVTPAGEAYLLYRNPAWVIYPDDLVRHANNDTLPDALFGGFYRLVFLDAAQRNVVYARTDQSVETVPERTPPISGEPGPRHTRHARGRERRREYLAQTVGATFPGCADDRRVTVAPRYSAQIVFADENEPVYELYVDLLVASAAMTVSLTLIDGAGLQVQRPSIDLEPNRARRFTRVLPAAVRARARAGRGRDADRVPARLTIGDLRVQGQTRALADYVHRMLRFPAP